MSNLLLYGFLFLFSLYILPRYLRYRSYKKSSYYQVTNKRFSTLDKGEFGEYLIFKSLKSFEKQGGKFLFNLYIPKPNDETTEIDVVLIHPKGFFVFESKNYNGWIFGDENNRYWTQVLPMGKGRTSHKRRFYSPLRQNGTHIKHLKRILSDETPMWSVIVFSNDCTFKNVTFPPDQRYKVIHLHELKSLVNKIIKESEEDVFSSNEVQLLYDKLYPFTQTNEETKVMHKIKPF